MNGYDMSWIALIISIMALALSLIRLAVLYGLL